MNDADTGRHFEALRQQTVLARFGEFALKSDNLDEILTQACRLVGQALGTDLAKVVELQEDGATLLVRAGVGWKPGVVGEMTIQVADDTSEGHALKTGRPMISPDIETERRFRYPWFLTDNGVKAVANVVILGASGKRPIGILQIDSREPRAFDDHDTAFLQSYADLIAAAVERLRVIGELRDREARLRASLERQQAALETGLLGFFDWDVPAATITADRHFAGFCGLEPVAAGAGMPLSKIIERVDPDDRASVTASVEGALASCSDYAKELRLVHADGTMRWVHVRGHCTEREGGLPLRYAGTAVDITVAKASEQALLRSKDALEARVAERTLELMQANERLRAEAVERERVEAVLRQSQKMEALGHLTGGIAHDFNNMLQAIDGSLELMSRRVEQGRAVEAAKLVSGARITVERAAALTNRLLAFARRQALQPRPVEPDALVRGLVELIQRMTGPGITIEVRLHDGVWTVLCDPNQLENVLLNIAINARDAMPGGGTLTIATRDLRLSAADVAGQDGAQPGNYVEVAVADTGTGMDETIRQRAFEPFFTTKPIGEGTGLGLSQVYGFVRQSGGVVKLDSAPGQGTTVRLFLPQCGSVQDTQLQPTTTAEPDTVATSVVLLVEDEEQVRFVAAEALRDRGYLVLEAPDGPAALAILHGSPQTHVDLLVTDVGLPGGLNGRQVADAARTTRPDLPVLFITGHAGDALKRQLAPGMMVVGKPFTLAGLAAHVQSMIEGSAYPATG